MPSVFWDRKGILLIDFLSRRETINADAYCTTLKRLQHAIQNCWWGLLTSGTCLLHDNTWPHTAGKMTKLLEKSGWENLDHPPYSPDLEHSDFHLFQKWKRFWAANGW
jgi:hypothetical protein